MASSVLIYPPKRPDEILDYELDWTAHCAGDTLTGARVTVDGATMVSQSRNGFVVTFRVAGGVAGTRATITCEVDGTSGQLYETAQTLRIVA